MSDLISRQAAIDAIDEISREVDDGDGFDYAKWREYFCELPPAEPHWIPCSERLPEYGKDVLSITQDDVYEVNHIIDDVHGEWFWEDNGEVIAWMPMPAPWKGE